MADVADYGRISAAKAWQRALELTAPIAATSARTLPVVIRECAARFGDSPALLSDHESLSYRELDARADQYAAWAIGQGVGRGEAVGLLMANRPEYVAIWLGITRVGGVVALLNTQLRGESLVHCVRAAGARRLIVAGHLADETAAALARGGIATQVWAHGLAPLAFRRIDLELGERHGEQGPASLPHIEERALLIYTSGTTGLPKAASISHGRLMQWSFWFAGMMDTSAADRMYDALPLYHSVGGVVAIGSLLVSGGSVIVREGFSARSFWQDIVRWDCTLFQYIGELCRYLLHSPPVPEERKHRLRMACGNGMRADVWERFAERFGIPRIFEFYAATEGNVSLFNIEGKPGAIGRVPGYLAHRFPLALVRFDPASEQPRRNAEGLCERCDVNEPGEALGRIKTSTSNVGASFEGYTSREATEAKIVRDVFAKGDAWFRTGDLMRRDAEGYFYFVDRIGDTFRWKGENVSTTEVANVILRIPHIKDALVYGVAVPGAEGRACMAAITVEADFDLLAFHRFLADRLPRYARPLFVRLCPTIGVTATFKHTKQKLVDDGYDPVKVGDPLYFADRARDFYVPLDPPLYDRIRTGAVPV